MGLLLTVLLPAGCPALYVYRTRFGLLAGAAAQVPQHGLLLNKSEQKLRDLQLAQQAFFKTLRL
jgi:hypothetical protein